MCRLAAFPPGFPRKEAAKIIDGFASWNKDGTGSAYLKDGKLVMHRYPFAFDKVMREKKPLLDHMPHDGWTIVHVRAATHGSPLVRNTHPFVKGPWAVVHNGIYGGYRTAQALLEKLAGSEFEGETDSEVAAELFNQLGPVKFSEALKHEGVFLGLNIEDGSMAAVNTGGSLEMVKTKYGVLLASTIPYTYKNETRVERGWIKLDPKGNITTKKFKEEESWSYNTGGGFHGGGSRGVGPGSRCGISRRGGSSALADAGGVVDTGGEDDLVDEEFADRTLYDSGDGKCYVLDDVSGQLREVDESEFSNVDEHRMHSEEAGNID